MSLPPIIDHFAPLADRYDVVLSDVWGVVHNGAAATPEACDALARFRANGGTVVLITNAPRPGEVVARITLDRFGVPHAAYDGIVSSGDVTRALIAARAGQHLFHIGPPRDLGIFEGLDAPIVALESADYAVCSGLIDDTVETPQDYHELIERMRARALTMICANPDVVVERGHELVYCAGAIADLYAAAGDYPVSLFVTTDKGCSSQAVISTVTVHDLPAPDFSLPKICITDPQALFNDSSIIADGTEAQFTYQWDFGEPSSGGANVSTQKNATHKYQAAGPYSVTLKVTSGAGCAKDTVKTFTVNGDNPIANFTIANAAQLCSNQPVVLTDASSVTPGSIIRVEVYWDYQNDPTIHTIDDTPSTGKQYNHSYPDFSTPPTENFQLRYVVYSGQNCVKELPQSITVLASPRTQFDALAIPKGETTEAVPFGFVPPMFAFR